LFEWFCQQPASKKTNRKSMKINGVWCLLGAIHRISMVQVFTASAFGSTPDGELIKTQQTTGKLSGSWNGSE
jgi:hypothetical protein